jgi:hypothetical protein
MMKRMVFVAAVLAMLAVLAPAAAQDYEVVADNLLNPRQISFDAAGNLYIAEAGIGGDLLNANDEPYGATSQVTMVTPDGDTSVMLRGLLSFREGNSLGTHALLVTDEAVWVLIGESADVSIPWSYALVELSPETYRVRTWVDLYTPEIELNPDGNADNASNPVDFTVAADGTVLIANAGCNCIMSWTPDAGVGIAASWDHATDNPVPTSIAVDANGDLYVGFLTGFPFPEGGSRVERWSGGELAETYSGLTAVTDVLVAADGTVYAVEYGIFNGETFQWGPGRVVSVSAEGITPVAEGLNFPYSIAQSPDGGLYVSVGSIGEGTGQVIALP